MSALRCAGFASTSGVTVLLSCSLNIDTAHDDCTLVLCVNVALAPATTDLYAGVNVYQSCPSPLSEKCGAKKYG